MRALKVTYGYISSVASSKQNKYNSEVMCHLLWLRCLQTPFVSAVDLFFFKKRECNPLGQNFST